MRHVLALLALLLWGTCAWAAVTVPCIFTRDVPITSPFDATCPTSFGTPKGLLTIGPATLGTDNNIAISARIMVGMSDGTRQYVSSVNTTDGVTAVDSHKLYMTDQTLLDVFNAGTIDGEYACTTFATDKVTCTASNTSAAAFFGTTFTLFGGTDLSVYTGTFTANATSGSGTAVTAPGFKPDLVFVTSIHTAALDTTTDDAQMCFGAAIQVSDVVTQASLGMFDDDAATDTVMGLLVEDRYACAHVTATVSTATAQQAVEIDSFDSQGFTATSRVESLANVVYGYTAFNFNGQKKPFLVQFNSPTATGTTNITIPNSITPEYVLLVGSLAQALRTGEADDDANAVMLAQFNATQSRYMYFVEDDNAATIDNQNGAGTPGFIMQSLVGTEAHNCTISTMTEGNIALSCTVANATARKWFVVGWGSAPTAARRRAGVQGD